MGLAGKRGYAHPEILRRGEIDGLLGLVTLERDGTPQTTALALEDGRLSAIYMVRNPDKLSHLKF